jgi:hypothetical protein
MKKKTEENNSIGRSRGASDPVRDPHLTRYCDPCSLIFDLVVGPYGEHQVPSIHPSQLKTYAATTSRMTRDGDPVIHDERPQYKPQIISSKVAILP